MILLLGVSCSLRHPKAMPFGLICPSLGVVFALTFEIILNNIVMTQIHVVVRRIIPAIKVDLVQIGYLEDGQFTTLPFDSLKVAPLSKYLESSSVSDSPYIEHHSVSALIAALTSYPNFAIDFFDNTLVLMFDLDLPNDESSSEEEGKGH